MKSLCSDYTGDPPLQQEESIRAFPSLCGTISGQTGITIGQKASGKENMNLISSKSLLKWLPIEWVAGVDTTVLNVGHSEGPSLEDRDRKEEQMRILGECANDQEQYA